MTSKEKRLAEAKFDLYWLPEPNSGCWLWMGPVRETNSGPRGYLQFDDGAKRWRISAHRVAYELRVGPVGVGLSVLHKCDVTICVNPDHLFTGDQTDNMRDCAEKGRILGGTALGTSSIKLTAGQVVEIRERREAGESGVILAKEYGVNHAQIYRIANGKSRVVHDMEV